MAFDVKDHFYHRAKQEDYLARSIYKLEEIDQKFKLLSKGMTVVDLGHYPGSWMQYTAKVIGPTGFVVGIDLQGVQPKLNMLPQVRQLAGDIFAIQGPKDLGLDRLVDVVLSDMAPNTTGLSNIDQIRSLELVEKVFELLPLLLKPKGSLVIKVFESQEAQNFFKQQRTHFGKIDFLRPKSTRKTSKEYFVIAKDFKA